MESAYRILNDCLQVIWVLVKPCQQECSQQITCRAAGPSSAFHLSKLTAPIGLPVGCHQHAILPARVHQCGADLEGVQVPLSRHLLGAAL